jgi:hypothetical protein
MKATQHHRAALAGRPTEGLHPRIAHRRRLSAFVELFTDASRKPDAVYAIQRKDPRVKLYDEREREIIHQGIKDGVISRERIVRYRLSQLLDDLAQFPHDVPVSDVVYVRLMAEQAEALEAQAIARALPTSANRDAAVRETKDAIAMQHIACVALEQGTFAPRLG